MVSFQRLIRFLASDGKIYYGEPVLKRNSSDISRATRAYVIAGDVFGTHTVTDRVLTISHLLAPLSPAAVGTVRCLGLNYASHAKESGMPLPNSPVLFYKPSTALGAPNAPISVPRIAQGPGLDYEAELIIVIGRECRDVSVEEAHEYIIGYCVGNDVSHRPLQLGPGQWSLGKGFDSWAPFGPGIVSTRVIKDPHALRITTRVNGEVRQNSSTADMIFKAAQIVSLLSQGTTLIPRDLIFTGTPEGVAMGGAKGKERWLKDGDVVEVELEGVGVCRNKVVFEGVAEPKL